MLISDWSSDVCSADLAVLTQKERQIPFLPLAAIPTLPQLSDQVFRQIIGQPAGRFGNDRDEIAMDAGFFLKLAQRRIARVLALVDAALGHLPRLGGVIDALADEHESLAVAQHDADAGTLGDRKSTRLNSSH